MSNWLYLDHAATTPLRRESLEAMWPWLTADFENPSSTHTKGRNARAALEHARQQLAYQLGCHANELTFTSGGSEADNLAIKGLALGVDRPLLHRRILISSMEHAAVEGACEYLRRFHGYTIERIPVNSDGLMDLQVLADHLERPTALCSVVWAHNEVGTIQSLEEIHRLTHEKGVPLHVDAVQAAGWLPMELATLPIEALSISGHKLGAGRGIGALFVRRGIPLEPLIHGGLQEQGRRGGTENLPGAIALACAYRLACIERPEKAMRLMALRDQLIYGVLDGCPQARLTGHPSERLPHHASFIFPGVHGESILLQLENRGILCSSGSACKAGADDPSPSLLAMGIPAEEAQTAVRFCLDASMDSTLIDSVIRAVINAVKEIRSLGGK